MRYSSGCKTISGVGLVLSIFRKNFVEGKDVQDHKKKKVKSVLAFHKSSLCFLIGFNSEGSLDMSAALELKY